MRILILNSGSSTLKFKVLSLDEHTPDGEERILARGLIEKIGGIGMLKFIDENGKSLTTSTPREKTKMITLQLGSGCSATAIEEGQSIDTSMGLTPLEGLMMGRRSGDIVPHLPHLLAQREGIRIAEVETIPNRKSGLLGVSGYSQDVRELLERESQGDENSALAFEMFCYRVKKQIGAYFAALGGAEAVVFGGGTGENSFLVPI